MENLSELEKHAIFSKVMIKSDIFIIKHIFLSFASAVRE